jgi:hypothetical protein
LSGEQGRLSVGRAPISAGLNAIGEQDEHPAPGLISEAVERLAALVNSAREGCEGGVYRHILRKKLRERRSAQLTQRHAHRLGGHPTRVAPREGEHPKANLPLRGQQALFKGALRLPPLVVVEHGT